MTPRIFFFTDVHLQLHEAAAAEIPFEVPDADICVVAGDISDCMSTSMEWLATTVGKKMPVVLTLGNHDYYGYDVPSARRSAPARARELGLNLLDDSSVVVQGVRFVGGTLWTDFRLFEGCQPPLTKQQCMSAVRRELADYVEIHATEVVGGVMSRTLTPRDTVGYHEATVAYLDRVLAEHFDGPTVVVTHHAPCPGSIHPKFYDQPSSAAYASDLTWMIEKHCPEYWFHGHVHDSFDYVVGATRIVCNPRGYARFPNPGFDPSLVLGFHPKPLHAPVGPAL